jgi:3-oxo-5-alpha-steroid 4-dehydrogenase 1
MKSDINQQLHNCLSGNKCWQLCRSASMSSVSTFLLHAHLPLLRAGYKIPRGGLFEYVSAANYFAEMVEWTGFAIAAGGLAPAVFAWFTFCNLAPRGARHHWWYKATFKDAYPATRKAVIPFIW